MTDTAAEKSGDGETTEPKAEKTFTQAEVNALIDRRFAKFRDYDDLKTKAGEYDKLQESAKTETQKASERAEAAEKRVAEFEARDQQAAWAAEVSKETGVPASALRGSTKEELAAHAAELAELVKPGKKGAIGPYVPGEGSAPSNSTGTTGDKFAEFIEPKLK